MAMLRSQAPLLAKDYTGLKISPSDPNPQLNTPIVHFPSKKATFPSIRAQSAGQATTTAATAATAAATALKATQYSGKDRVDILAEALPFIQRFQGKTVVVKYGGAAMKDESLKDGVIKDLVLLSCVGMRPVLVHGGGPEINQWLTKLGIQPNFKNGLRVTDAATMEVVEMVLVGKVSTIILLQ
jgi:acetylglutamate kinase